MAVLSLCTAQAETAACYLTCVLQEEENKETRRLTNE